MTATAGGHRLRTAYRPLNAPRRPDQQAAGLVPRAGALVLDALVGFTLVPVAVSVFFIVSDRDIERCEVSDTGIVVDGVTVFAETCAVDTFNQWLSRVMFWTLFAAYVALISWQIAHRRTIGSRATGTTVVDADTGGRISFGRALLRTGVMILGAIPLGLGHWWALWQREGRTWHDLAARTRVIGY